LKGTKIAFSGDLGRYDDGDSDLEEAAAIGRIFSPESTHGDRQHDALSPEKALGERIERCIARGGTVVIPAFAVGRAQSLLHLSFARHVLPPSRRTCVPRQPDGNQCKRHHVRIPVITV
jgi:metallo-beta-lactamase family protein